jgi:hypothetical protein
MLETLSRPSAGGGRELGVVALLNSIVDPMRFAIEWT